MGKSELVVLLSLSSWCTVIVVWLLLAVPLACLRFMIVVFPDHTHLLCFVKHSSATGHIRYYFYGDLVYKFKRIVGKPNFSDQIKMIIKRYKKSWI